MSCEPSIRDLVGTAKVAASLASTAVATAYHGDEAASLSDLRNACDWLAQALAEASVARDLLAGGVGLDERRDFSGECALRHAAAGEVTANGNAALLVSRAKAALRMRDLADRAYSEAIAIEGCNPVYLRDRGIDWAIKEGVWQALRETLELLHLPVPDVDDLA